MSDIKSKEERSKNMAAIKSKDTKPEVYLRKLLFHEGFRYRKNVNYIYGHPDIYLAKYNLVIFVHGCFWHRHEGCKYTYMPKSRKEFWTEKFEKNVQRDLIVRENLKKSGVRCLTVWECTIRQMIKSSFAESIIIKDICNFIVSDQTNMEL